MKEVLIDGVRYVPAEPQVDPLEEVKAAHRAGYQIEQRKVSRNGKSWCEYRLAR